ALTAIATQHKSGQAPAGGSSNTIQFNGPMTITLSSNYGALPAINHQATITEPSGKSPLVMLNGASVAGIGLNFVTGSNRSTVRGLVLQQFAVGIELSGSNNDRIVGDYIGTDAGGQGDMGNSSAGVILSCGASNNTIGGTASADGNVISANGIGVEIDGPVTM